MPLSEFAYYWKQQHQLCALKSFLNTRELTKSSDINACLTHWGRVTHICVDKLSIIGSDNDLFWTNAGILLIVPLGTNFSGILIGIQTYSLKKIRLKMSSAKSQVGNYATAWMDSWRVTQQILYNFCNKSLTSSPRNSIIACFDTRESLHM